MSASVEAVTLPEAIKMQINTMRNHLPWSVDTWTEYSTNSSNLSVNYLEQKDCIKGQRLKSCSGKWAWLDVAKQRVWACAVAIIQSDCQYFYYKIYYLVMLISEGMTRPRNAWNMLYTRNSHELAMFVAR
jgi:hypothetical protein